MSHDLQTRAELVKLARLLDLDAGALAYLEPQGAADLKELREGISAARYDEHRALYQRIAGASKLLPAALTAKIAERAFPPVISARVSAELPAARAADLAKRMPVSYLADVCVDLDPRKVKSIIERIPVDRSIKVATELVHRDEHLTLGRLIDAASDEQLLAVAAKIESDEALVWIGFYAESPARLTGAVQALPEDRLRSIVHTSIDGRSELHSAGLALISRLSDEPLRSRLGDLAAECAAESLTRLVHTAVAEGFVPELLAVVACMSEDGQRRVVGLPVLQEREVLVALVNAAADGEYWDPLLPLVEHMDQELRGRLAALVSELDDDVLRAVVDTAHREGRWPELLPLVGTMQEQGRRRVASLVSELDDDVLCAVVDTAHREGLWPQLLAVAPYLDADSTRVLAKALGTPDGELLSGLVRAVDQADEWRAMLGVLAGQDADTQRETAAGWAGLTPEDRALVEGKARELGLWDALAPLRGAVDA